MPGRNFTSEKYRYGFNGQEKDDEIKGSGNSYDFGERMQDPRLGRFSSPDPLTFIFPWQSPYAYTMNSPITFTDYSGLGPKITNRFVEKYSAVLSNVISFARNIVHSLSVIAAVDPITKSSLSPNFRAGRGNYAEIFNVIPGQTSFWFNDNVVYDRIQLIIPDTDPPVILWDSDNSGRQKKDGYFLPTVKDPIGKGKKHPLGIKEKGLVTGWGNIPIPTTSPGGTIVDKVQVVVTTNKDPASNLHNIDVNNLASQGAQKESVWGIDILPKEKPEKKEKQKKKEKEESHINPRFLR